MTRPMVDLEEHLDPSNEYDRRVIERAMKRSEARRAMVTPTNADGTSPFRCPPLLEERRVEHGVPDACFDARPSFDNVLIYQLPKFAARIGSIHMPDATKQALEESAPHGIIIGAGLRALDSLLSHGIDLGHIVTYVTLSPWRTIACHIEGEPVVVLHALDIHIRASEDLEQAYRAGKVSITKKKNEAGFWRHYYQDENGEPWNPQHPSKKLGEV